MEYESPKRVYSTNFHKSYSSSSVFVPLNSRVGSPWLSDQVEGLVRILRQSMSQAWSGRICEAIAIQFSHDIHIHK